MKNNSTLQSLSISREVSPQVLTQLCATTLQIYQIPHFYRKQLKNCTSPQFLCWFKIFE